MDGAPRSAAAVALFALAVALTMVAVLTSSSESVPSRFVTAEYTPYRLTVRSGFDGRVLRVLEQTDHDHRPFDVVVSPDGSTVYFSRFGRSMCEDGMRNETPEIMRVRINGGPVEPLDPPGHGYNLAITPDGSALTFNGDASGTGCGPAPRGALLVRRDLKTGRMRTLVDPERDGVVVQAHHSWTPDGSRLLCEGYLSVDDVPRLFRVDLKDDGIRVTPLPDNHEFPAGVALSNESYAASFRDKLGFHVASFDFDGTFRRILFDYEAAFSPVVDPSMHHFLYVRQGQGREPSTLVTWSRGSGRRVVTTGFIQGVAWVPDPR